MLFSGRASVNIILGNSVNELPHSQNGSYILPSGIIILVDEDVDAYMDGTLIFYSGEIEYVTE